MVENSPNEPLLVPHDDNVVALCPETCFVQVAHWGPIAYFQGERQCLTLTAKILETFALRFP